MNRTAMGIILMSAAIGCQEAAESTTESEIKNGTVWNPWTQQTQTWTRNVVRVGGCTGTLLDYEWVMSATHCFDEGQNPASITVSHRLADGTTETAVGAELHFAPGWQQGNDIALIRLATPLTPGVATLPITTGTTADLIGDTIFCAGYGAIDTGNSCSDSSDCNSGEWCQWGLCMVPSDGQLRTASLTVIEDPVDSNMWYRLQVPNALDQQKLPGDSGSSCWNGIGLTGVHKAGNGVNYNRDTSGPYARDWIQSLVTPTILKDANQPAAYCKPVGAGVIDYQSNGNAMNASATSLDVSCPITRPVVPAFADFISVPRVWVYDRSSTDDVCCSLVSKNAGGAEVTSEAICSQGNSSDYQTLVLPSVRDNFSFSHASVQCSIPAATASGSSGLHGYRARQADR